jgi:para-nitrobenzyl esterase
VSGTRIEPNPLDSALSNGSFLQVPVIQGINANEGRYFEPALIPFAASFGDVVAAGGPANYDLFNANDFCKGKVCSYPQEINLALAAEGISSSVNTKTFDAKLAKKYPLKHFRDPYLANKASSSDEALSQIGTDWAFACNAQDANEGMAQFVSTYGYEFDDPEAPPTLGSPPVTQEPNDQYGFPSASEHGAELQFLFAFPSTPSLSKGEQKLAKAMQAYWANFVASGNPNKGAKVTPWPGFAGGQRVQELSPGKGGNGAIGNFADEHFCSLWEPIINP